MQKINVVYDGCLENVDILLVPDDVADDIERITQEFFNWLAVPENGDRFRTAVIDGRKFLSIGTDEFIWWLNIQFTILLYQQQSSE